MRKSVQSCSVLSSVLSFWCDKHKIAEVTWGNMMELIFDDVALKYLLFLEFFFEEVYMFLAVKKVILRKLYRPSPRISAIAMKT